MRLRALAPAAIIVTAAVASLAPAVHAGSPVSWRPLGTYDTGLGEESAETAAYEGNRLFVTNSADNSLDIVSTLDPRSPSRIRRVDLSPYGAGPNSVAVSGNLVAVAVEASPKTDPGAVVFLTPRGRYLGSVTVGALPDMLTFTPDGRRVVVANEGEPGSYDEPDSVDPQGSISVIDVAPFEQARLEGGTVADGTARTIGFRAFNQGGARHGQLPAGIRLNGPDASVAQDLEPEYVAIASDSRTAWVTLQEANAIAILDLERLRVTAIRSLGTKRHSVSGNGLDPSDENGYSVDTWPVRGLYMPDAVAVAAIGGRRYIVTANEGDARDWDGFGDEERVEDLDLDPTAFPNAAELQTDDAIGRLNVSRTDGATGAGGAHERLFAFGARSMTVWTTAVKRVGDTGDQLETWVQDEDPDAFNVSNDNNDVDNRSDNKGPEPEGIAFGVVGGVPYAFVGLERVGGFMTVDLSDPTAPQVVDWANTRDYTADPPGPDSGPEVIHFVPNHRSQTGRPLVIVANEISGTVTIYRLGSPVE